MSNGTASTFLRLIRRAQRGRLKVYLGYCAGVGKTWQMLQEGHRLKADGVDVVVGLVETHGRAETAQLVGGLEVLPRVRREYRGVTLEEMDTRAILARRPEVVLVDELAHTNVPGSKNAKRYEDVQDILDAGIHVITTLNVQHLVSLYNTVEASVGVRVRERLPDSVLGRADQIVNVDLATEDLQRRMRDGKIYPAERVQSALDNFFVRHNLEQLREMTLRELASQIDLRRREPEEDDASLAADQVMVCLSSRGPNSEMLLRYASRLAGRLNRNWYALYVQTPSEDPTAIDAATQRILAGTLTLAKQLGAIVFTYKGQDIAETVLRFAREYRVGHIVVGHPAPVPLRKRLFGRRSIVERLVGNDDGITVVVLGAKSDRIAAEAPTAQPRTVNPGPAPSMTPLPELLSEQRILVWDEPVLKEEVLNALAAAALTNAEPGLIAQATRRIWEREQQGSTFFNEGVAFPHARLENIDTPRVALGLTRAGVADVATDKPVQIVFLILTPLAAPNTQLQVLARASRAAQNRRLAQQLREATSPREALMALHAWNEELHETTTD